MVKPIKKLSLLLMIMIAVSCSKMEDNYQKYLDMNLVYSPKISNLSADVGLKQATLFWTNPQGDLAKKILVDYQDDSIKFESMVDSVFLDSLEIKGYLVKVFTLDEFGNYSVPTQIQIFPNGEQ